MGREKWVEITIEDSVEVLDHKRVPLNYEERYKIKGDYPYYGATGIVDYISEFLFCEELLLVGEDGAPFFDKTKDIAYIINGKTWVNNHAHVLKANSITSNQFLKFFFNQFNFTGYVNGTTRLKLNQAKLKQIPVFLPPLAEQHRIVEKLDAILPRVKAAKARLEKIPAVLKRFRQSVLATACSGRLTEYFKIEQNFPNWYSIKLNEVAVKVGSGSTPRGGQGTYKTSGIPLIRSMNVHFHKFNYYGLAFIDDRQANDLKNVSVNENDILLNITGASIGRVCLIPKDLLGARVNQHVCIIRLKPILMPQFLVYYLASPMMQDYILKENYGATRQALTKEMILDFSIPVPALSEQHEIVHRVEKLFSLADSLEAKYHNAMQRIEKIEQSILAKAFRGELVPQDPNDEPAEELLKRILEEKSKAIKKTSKTKRK